MAEAIEMIEMHSVAVEQPQENEEDEEDEENEEEKLDGLKKYNRTESMHPLRYDIALTTHIHEEGSGNKFKFEGKVFIKLHVEQYNINEIKLHQRNIVVTDVTVFQVFAAGNTVVAQREEYHQDYEFLYIKTPVLIKGRNYQLEIDYEGKLFSNNGYNAGFYCSSYQDASGKTKWIATTQFKATDARRAFPCFDEPGFLTPIGLKLNHDKTYHAIANMPVKSRVAAENNYVTTEFEMRYPMPTYLLAFVVSDFWYCSEARTQTIYANPTLMCSGDLNFALEVGVKVLQALESYLQRSYSLPKLDLVVIPDLATGAMENWGLVTFRAGQLIHNSKSPMGQLKRIATSIAHEYAHQLIGNLRCPIQWGYVWLNEGLATLMQYIAAHRAYPDLRIQDMITVEVVQNALAMDSLENTHAMTTEAKTPSAVKKLFDDITYNKSCAVLRQLQHALGDDVFLDGLKNYLDESPLQPATPDGFARGMQASVAQHNIHLKFNVVDFLNSWANQKGYPVLHVTRRTDNSINLKQKPYNQSDGSKPVWYLPYNLATAQTHDFSSTLPKDWLFVEEFDVHPTESLNWNDTDWVIFNKQQTGFYRINYDTYSWNLIINELLDGEPRNIHHLNRAQLIDDSFNLARTNHLHYHYPLTLAQYIAREEEYVPWASLNNGLTYLDRMLVDSAKYALFKQYVWKLVKPALCNFGLVNKPGEAYFTKLTRNILINWACRVGPEAYQTQINAQLAKVVSNEIADIEPNLKSVVYCNGLRNADRATFMFVLDRMKCSHDASERLLLIKALGCSQNRELLLYYLKSSLDKTSYSGHERWCMFSAVYSNGNIGLEAAMEFLVQNKASINRKYNGGVFGGRVIGKAVFEMGKHVVNEKQRLALYELMHKELKKYLNAGEKKRANDEAMQNARWANRYYAHIETWLDQRISSEAKWFKTIFIVAAAVVIVLGLAALYAFHEIVI